MGPWTQDHFHSQYPNSHYANENVTIHLWLSAPRIYIYVWNFVDINSLFAEMQQAGSTEMVCSWIVLGLGSLNQFGRFEVSTCYMHGNKLKWILNSYIEAFFKYAHDYVHVNPIAKLLAQCGLQRYIFGVWSYLWGPPKVKWMKTDVLFLQGFIR